MNKQPNILFLMSDEHRADVAGFGGNSVVRTPVLDQLAESGSVFTNAYTPSPICIPARQCMMSGQLPKTCHCEGGKDLEPNYMTFARRLAEYAYSTVVCGKLPHTGLDVMQGWTQRIGSDPSQKVVNRNEEAFARYTKPLGSVKWSNAKEVLRAGIGQAQNVVRDAYNVQGAIHFIEDYFLNPYYDREKHHQPLLLKVSLSQPHYPYSTSKEKFTYYLNRVQPYINEETFDHPFLRKFAVSVGDTGDVTERDVRRATAAYYGMVETVDEQFGRVLQALEEVGQSLDEWLIIYTSDHGEMLGQHGIWEKQKFFEASVRVPLIIRYPEKLSSGKMIHENVNLCDLFATICEVVDVPIPEGLDSRSLVSLMRGDAGEWNNETISQFGTSNVLIKRNQLKYQYYGEKMPEVLFDLERNPEETVNFIGDSAYGDEIEQFRKRLTELGHGFHASSRYVNAGY